jgi:hypothetical protein
MGCEFTYLQLKPRIRQVHARLPYGDIGHLAGQNNRPGETARYDITKVSVRNPQDFFARRSGGIIGVLTKHAATRAKMLVPIGRRHAPIARSGGSVSRMVFRRTSLREMRNPRSR